MAKSDSFDGVAQGDVLLRFRLLAKKSRSEVGVAVGMEGDTYRKYETGQTELRVSQIPVFAAAFGVSPRALSEALGLLVETPYDFRAALHGQIPDDQIADLWEQVKDRKVKDQMAAAETVLQIAAERRAEAMAPPSEPKRPPRRRRDAENRSA